MGVDQKATCQATSSFFDKLVWNMLFHSQQDKKLFMVYTRYLQPL